MRPEKFNTKEHVDGDYGISTCCVHCNKPFVDIAKIKKLKGSNTVHVSFYCKQCWTPNSTKYIQN